MAIRIEKERLSRVNSLEFLARQVVEGFITGLHQSPFHGFSVEFAEHRLYNAGESIRHIDWKLYSRTDKLFVKRYKEETNLRCQLVIDHSASMYFPEGTTEDPDQPSKLLFSAYAAASLAELMRRQRDAVGLSLFADQINLHTQARSSSMHHQFILTEIEKVLKNEVGRQAVTTDAAGALHQLAEQSHRRSLVIIFSDLMDSNRQTDDVFAALQHLRYNKHEVILFHTHDSVQEEKLMLDNRPYRFVDLESHEILKLNPVQIQTAYREAFAKRKNELMLRCGQYQIDYVEADIRKGVDQVLIAYLIKRSKLY